MKRKYMAILLAFSVLSLTACGKDEVPDAKDAQEAKEETQDTDDPAAADLEYKQVSYEDLSSTLIRLGEYKGVEGVRAAVEVTDEEVEAEIWEMQKEAATLTDVDRAAEQRDVAVIEYTGYVDGETSDNLQGTYSLELGSGAFVPGFEEQLIGAVAGEDREVNVTFPADYYEDMAGKDARFDVHVQNVQEYVLDGWNEDYIRELGYEDQEDLTASVRADLEASAEEEADANLEYDLIVAVLDASEFDIQEEDVTAYTDEMLWSEYMVYANMYGVDLETLLRDYVGTTEEQIREMYRETAIFRVKMVLALHDIAEQEGIEVSEEDIQSWKEEMVEEYGYTDAEAVEAAYNMDAVQEQLVQQRVIDLVRESAVII